VSAREKLAQHFVTPPRRLVQLAAGPSVITVVREQARFEIEMVRPIGLIHRSRYHQKTWTPPPTEMPEATLVAYAE
jgi:hypothetical protein